MASFLLSAMPFAGHIAPVVALSSELVGRGHDVRIYTGRAFGPRVEASGARAVLWQHATDFDESNLPATFPRLRGKKGLKQVFVNLTDLFIGTAQGQLNDLEAEYARQPWDVLVSEETALGAALYTQKHDGPWATISITPLNLPSSEGPPTGLGLTPGRNPLTRARDSILQALSPALTAPLDRALGVVRERAGLGSADRGFQSAGFSSALVLATGVASLDFDRGDRPETLTWVGRLVAAVAPTEPPAWWGELDGRTVIHVTQGTQNLDPDDLIRPALQALAATDALVVVTTGIAGQNELPFPVPANVRVAGFIPHDALLPRVDVMITNGGWGGVLGALAHGIPLIVAGGDLDKPEVAARVAASGAGINLRTGTPSASAVERAYERLTSEPGFRHSAERLAAEIVSAGGVQTAAARLEQFAADVR